MTGSGNSCAYFDRAARRLAKVAGTGGAFLVLGGVVVWLLSPLGWVLVLLGVALLVYGPLLIAQLEALRHHDTLEATAA